MTSIEMDTYNRKRTLLKFILGKPEEQSALFYNIIYNELDKYKEYFNNQNPELKEYTEQFNNMLYESKLKEVEQQTRILKAHMIAQANKEKYPSVIPIIERKLYIVELQIDIGIYNLLKGNNVKYYFDK
jgi:hypothetical protein